MQIHSAIEAVDKNTGRIIDAALAKDYIIMVFADHGNAEDQTTELSIINKN